MPKSERMEGALVQLAQQAFLDKAPSLSVSRENVIGFQLVESNEDNTRAVGVFALTVGNLSLYVPAFYLGGRLRGLDLLYVVGQDLFVPFEEGWVNYLVSSQSQPLGVGVKEDAKRLGYTSPDFSGLARSKMASVSNILSRTVTKTGACVTFVNLDDAKLAKQMKAVMGRPRKNKKKKCASLHEILRQTPHLGLRLLDGMSKSAALKQCVTNTYGLTDTASFEAFFPSVTAMQGHTYKTANVQVFTLGATGAERLSDTEKTKLATGGVVIKDFRKGAAEIVHIENGDSAFTSPSMSGAYVGYAAGTGDPVGTYVEKAPLYFGVRDDVLGVRPVVLSEQGANGNISASADTGVDDFATSVSRIPEFKLPKWLADREDQFESLRPGSSYVLYWNGRLSNIFDVFPATNDADELVYRFDTICIGEDYRTRSGYSQVCKPGMEYFDQDSDTSMPFTRLPSTTFSVGDPSVTRFVRDGQHLVLPSDVKFLRIGNFRGGVRRPENPYSEPRLMSDTTLLGHLLTNSAVTSMLLSRTDDNYTLVSDDLRKSASADATKTILVCRYGLSVPDAESLLCATKKGSAQQVYIRKNAMYMPTVQFPSGGYDPTFGAYVEEPSTQTVQATGREPATPGQENPLLSDVSKDLVQGASNLQRDNKDSEIVDVSILTSLLGHDDPVATVEGYLPDMIRGMDRFGRTLFILYWSYEEFIERYGRDETVELEDSLRSVFNSMGRQILYLKKKTTESDPQRAALSMEL